MKEKMALLRSLLTRKRLEMNEAFMPSDRKRSSSETDGLQRKKQRKQGMKGKRLRTDSRSDKKAALQLYNAASAY